MLIKELKLPSNYVSRDLSNRRRSKANTWHPERRPLPARTLSSSPCTRDGACFQVPPPRDGLTCSLSTYLWKAPNASAPSLYRRRFWGERLYKEAALSVGTPRATGGQVACDCGSSAQPLGRNGSPLSPSGRHAAPHLPLLPPHFLFLVTDT